MKKFLVLVLAVVVFVSPLMAIDLSVDKAVEMVLSGPSLKSPELDLELAKYKVGSSYSSFVPTLQASLTVAKSNEISSMAKSLSQMSYALQKILNPQAEYVELVNNPNAVISLSAQFAFNPAMITSVKIAKSNLENGYISYEKAREEAKVNISKLYYGIVLQEQVLVIQKLILENQRQRMIQAETDYKNGLVPEIYLLSSQVTYENSKPGVAEAENALNASKRTLAMLIGYDDYTQIKLTDSIEQKIIDINEENILANIAFRYDLKGLSVQKQTLKLQEKALVERMYIPNIVLNASYVPTIANAKEKWGSESNKFSDNGNVSVTVAWNLSEIFPRSSSRATLEEVRSAQAKLDAGYSLAESSAKTEILNLVDSLKKDRESIALAEKTVVLAEKSYEITNTAFRSGSADALELRDSENQLNQAILGLLSGKYNYLCALIDLEYAAQQKIR